MLFKGHHWHKKLHPTWPGHRTPSWQSHYRVDGGDWGWIVRDLKIIIILTFISQRYHNTLTWTRSRFRGICYCNSTIRRWHDTLRGISGTYWLTYVSLTIVSRRPRIVGSIDLTVANFPVNDPDLWNPRRWKSQFTPQPACYSIYCTMPLRSVGSNLHSDIGFSWKFVLFSIHIILLGQDIYIHHVGYVCSASICIVLWGHITNLLT